MRSMEFTIVWKVANNEQLKTNNTIIKLKSPTNSLHDTRNTIFAFIIIDNCS